MSRASGDGPAQRGAVKRKRRRKRTPAVRVSRLTKRFGVTEALRGVSFAVPRGIVFSLLGRNGSGKTTTVRILTGLTEPTGGTVHVLGHDIRAHRAAIQARIGVTLQEAALDDVLTGREFLAFVASILGLPRGEAGARVEELLTLFGLDDAADRQIGTYSGGMQRRVDLAAALLRRPRILFLDEPTTGLDPQNRRALWSEIRRLRDAGTTVLLTTQYLEEAEALADRIAIIDSGRLVDASSPHELRSRHGATRLVVRAPRGRLRDVRHALGTGASTNGGGGVTLPVEDGDDALDVLRGLRRRGLDPDGFEIRRDSLEDVFLRLTGEATAREPDDTT